MGIKGIGPWGGAYLFKSFLSTPLPRASMLFVPAQKFSVIEWVYSLSSHTLRYGFSLLKSKYWSFVYLQLCLSDRRPGDFTLQYQRHYQWFGEWIHLTTQNEGNRRRKHILLSCFVLFRLICFYVFFFFSHQDSPNIAFFKTDRYHDTTHPEK